MKFLYVIWALLPLALIFMSINAYLRRVTKRPGEEDIKNYLKQAVFCSIILAMAIGIDQTFYEGMIRIVSSNQSFISIARILLYPFLLLCIAYLQAIKNREYKKAQEVRSRPYSKI